MKLQPIKTSLRWHLLNALTVGNEITELMAAASDDGIGMIVRWKKEADGWEAEVMDTEGGGWDYVEFYEEGCEIPVEPPFEFAPTEREGRAAAIIKDILVNHLPRVREGLEKGYVDENQILVIYDHAVRARILTEHID